MCMYSCLSTLIFDIIGKERGINDSFGAKEYDFRTEDLLLSKQKPIPFGGKISAAEFEQDELLLMTVGTLLAVLRLLAGGTAAVGSCDVLFLFRLGLDFVVLFLWTTAPTEGDSVFKDILEIVFHCLLFLMLLRFRVSLRGKSR